jgi:hypothetical protein
MKKIRLHIQNNKLKYFSKFIFNAEILYFVVIIIILVLPIKVHFEVYDEGIILTGAKRIIEGELPYKDFWTIYPPGQFYIVAFILKIFGNSLIYTRLFDTIIRFGIIMLIYGLSKEGTSRSQAKIVGIIVSIIIISATFYSNTIFTSLFLCLLAIFLFIKYIKIKHNYILWSIGIITGFGIFIRWDFTIYSTISIIISNLFYNYTCKRNESNKNYKNLSILFIGFSLIFIPLFILIHKYMGLENVMFHNFILPSTIIHASRKISIPLLPFFDIPFDFSYNSIKNFYRDIINWIYFYFPIFVYCISGIFYYRKIRMSNYSINIIKKYFNLITLLIFGIQLYLYSFFRYDYVHILPTTIIVWILAISLFNHSNKFEFIKKRSYLKITILMFFLIYFSYPLKLYSTIISSYPIYKCQSKLSRSSCFNINKDQEEAIIFITENTKDAEYLFVGNTRHDLITENNVGFYFLSSRRCATAYHELHPGIATTPEVQNQIISDIKIKNVRYIILVEMPLKEEKNLSSISNHIFLLDNFIKKEYLLVKKIGKYEIWKINNTY